MSRLNFNHNIRVKNKRRGVAEIISTLLLVMVTVVGSSSIIFFLNDGFVSSGVAASESLDSSTPSLKLVSYDARDSYDLLGVDNLNNTNPTDGILCGLCSGWPDSLPAESGTEFVIIQVRNNSIDPVFLHDLTINGIEHEWDPSASGPLVLSESLPTGNYPASGTFSIFDPRDSQRTLFDNNEIESGDTVNILIKLDSQMPDISLGKGIRILVDEGELGLIEFVIYGGEAR